MEDKEQILNELKIVQNDLRQALADLRVEVWPKLKQQERQVIEDDFNQIDSLIERLQSGLIWIAFFGKASVGKSSVINSILGKDVAEVHALYGTTTEADYYRSDPWMLIDVPGILDNQIHEDIAIYEAKRANGLVFVIEGEPLAAEMRLFEAVHMEYPDRPTIVFVNKSDYLEHLTRSEREDIKRKIEEKMSKFVRTPQDIVYGSARIKVSDEERERRPLPQLVHRMREDAGELGILINLWNPAKEGSDLAQSIREKIFNVRVKVARQVITSLAVTIGFGAAVLPLSSLYWTPFFLTSMIYAVFRVMGIRDSRKKTMTLMGDIFKATLPQIGYEFLLGAGAEMLFDAAVFSGLLTPLGLLGNAGLGVYQAMRTAVLGEATIEFIKKDCSWEGEDIEKVIQRCREQVAKHYNLKRLSSFN